MLFRKLPKLNHETINAVFDDDLLELLETLGRRRKFEFGEENCNYCGEQVDLSNLASLFRQSGRHQICLRCTRVLGTSLYATSIWGSDSLMDSAITKYLMGFFGGGGLVALIFFLFFNQERIELWRSYIFGFITRFAKFADKKYAATDIQGRVNLFMKDTQNKFPKLSAVGIKIEWIEANQDDSPIREENRLIIRMRRSEDQDKNFVQASMAFISFEFLRKAKRYISEGQSESLDVFFAHKLFEKAKSRMLQKNLSMNILLRPVERQMLQTCCFDLILLKKSDYFSPS